MKNLFLILLIILIIIVSVGAYFAFMSYKESSKSIEVIEEHGGISGSIGEGQGPSAKCPEGKRAVGGTCNSHSLGLELKGQDLIKTNSNLDYLNAWQCNFVIVEDGTHQYTVNVHCK